MKAYYFTFGCGHPLRNYAQRILATSEAKARETMYTFYGSNWAFCYGPFDSADPGERVLIGKYSYKLTDYALHEGETL